MTRADKVGALASVASVAIAIAVLTNTKNGRMAQGGVFWELIAFLMFAFAGIKGPRWWLSGPLVIILFWVGAAHVDFLWK